MTRKQAVKHLTNELVNKNCHIGLWTQWIYLNGIMDREAIESFFIDIETIPKGDVQAATFFYLRSYRPN